MSKKIVLSLGFAAIVSMTAISGASAADRSAMIDAIHANQDATRIQVMQFVAKSRATDLPIRTIALEARTHAMQAQGRMKLARLLEKSRQQNVSPVSVAYAEARQTEMAKKNAVDVTSDIDG